MTVLLPRCLSSNDFGGISCRAFELGSGLAAGEAAEQDAGVADSVHTRFAVTGDVAAELEVVAGSSPAVGNSLETHSPHYSVVALRLPSRLTVASSVAQRPWVLFAAVAVAGVGYAENAAGVAVDFDPSRFHDHSHFQASRHQLISK